MADCRNLASWACVLLVQHCDCTSCLTSQSPESRPASRIIASDTSAPVIASVRHPKPMSYAKLLRPLLLLLLLLPLRALADSESMSFRVNINGDVEAVIAGVLSNECGFR